MKDREHEISTGTWVDPARRKVTVDEWAADWLATRGDLRTTTRARLESVVRLHVSPAFGSRRLATIGNAEIRRWVAAMSESRLSAASVRKAVFALRQMLDAAVADRRISSNPAVNVPLPAEHRVEQRFLTQRQVRATWPT
jgi:site-specific recombinase XerD